MPIRWSPARVMEAVDMMEKHINAAAEPMECAREVAKAALEIPHLPEYIKSRILSLWSEIDRVIGNGRDDQGTFRKRLQSIRDDMLKDALEADKKASVYGETKSLI